MAQNIKRGKLIVFEGIDGCGKSTQISLLTDRLKESGINCRCTAEPAPGAIGGIIRDCLNARYSVTPYELAALFLADRISHNVNSFDGIINSLNNGINVICDRYYYSSIAYQGTDCGLQWVADMNINCEQITKPDLCIFLDVDPEKTYSRITKSGRPKEIYETDLKKTQEIRSRFFSAFELLKDRDKVVCIDADRSIDEIHEEILAIVLNCIGQ